jgi:hypothetical protein
MRLPCLALDGWQVEDADEVTATSGRGGMIPVRTLREAVATGSLCKLFFAMTGSRARPEPLWVSVQRREGAKYFGVLLQDASSSAAQEASYLAAGSEVPFAARHIAEIIAPYELGPDERALAALPPTQVWVGRGG